MNGIELITEERKRQVEKKGFDAKHDRNHMSDELATAGAIYAMPEKYRQGYLLNKWPWEMEWYKPCSKDRKRELVKAGALIAAEIDRIIEQECEEGWFAFNPNRSFDERCEIVRRTAITEDMTYEERLAMLKARYGL